VHQLSLFGGGGAVWEHTDLTRKAEAPIPMESLAGYVTCLSQQGPVARVLYTTPDHHVHELFTFG
jgi:hypothetical protein